MDKKRRSGVGGKAIGPIEVSPKVFDTLADTLKDFRDYSPKIDSLLSGEGNITAIVTDGNRYIGIDPQGYDYPRYKTVVRKSFGAVVNIESNPKSWRRKYEKEGKGFNHRILKGV